MTTPTPAGAEPEPEEETRLTAQVRFNLLPTELAKLQQMAAVAERPVSQLVRRAVREMLFRYDYSERKP